MEQTEETLQAILGLSLNTCSKRLVTLFGASSALPGPVSALAARAGVENSIRDWDFPSEGPNTKQRAGGKADALSALRLVRCYQQRRGVGCEYTLL